MVGVMELLSTLVVTLLALVCLSFQHSHGLKYNSIAKYYSAYRRRCVEKSLEAREASADAVFTGTIKDLIPDHQKPDLKVSFQTFRY